MEESDVHTAELEKLTADIHQLVEYIAALDAMKAKATAIKKSSDVQHKDYCIDELTRVKKTIDGMIAQLREKKTDEVNHKDFCADDLNINQLETEKKDRAKSGLKAKN